MEILDTDPKDFFSDIGRRVINQTNTDHSIGYVETLHQENKEVYQELIKSKDDQIALLQETMKQKDRLIDFLQSIGNK